MTEESEPVPERIPIHVVPVYEPAEIGVVIDYSRVAQCNVGLAPCCKASRTTVQSWHRLRLLSNFISENGYGPTMRELRDIWNIGSESTAKYFITRMERFGWIERDYADSTGGTAKPRAVRITSAGRSAILDYIQWQVSHQNFEMVAPERFFSDQQRMRGMVAG